MSEVVVDEQEIEVPTFVLDALEEVRASGRVTMGDREEVKRVATLSGGEAVYDWLEQAGESGYIAALRLLGQRVMAAKAKAPAAIVEALTNIHGSGVTNMLARNDVLRAAEVMGDESVVAWLQNADSTTYVAALMAAGALPLANEPEKVEEPEAPPAANEPTEEKKPKRGSAKAKKKAEEPEAPPEPNGMAFKVLQENLKEGLATVAPAIAGKSTLPILGNVLIATERRGDRLALKLQRTNLETAITTWIGVDVKEEGSITLPHKLLTDVVSGLPNEAIEFVIDVRTQTAKLTCGRFTTNIKGIEGDEFPSALTIDQLASRGAKVVSTTLPVAPFSQAISQVVVAAATDDSRPILAGVYLEMDKDKLFLAAADGFNLAIRTITLPAPVEQKRDLVVPARVLDNAARAMRGMDDEEEVTLYVVQTDGTLGLNVQFLLAFGQTEVLGRIMDGKFPDVRRIIPRQFTGRAVMDKAEFARRVKLAKIFATQSQNVIKFEFTPSGESSPGYLDVSANAAEVGDNMSVMEVLGTGQGGQIALNVKYLEELIGVITSTQLAMEMQTQNSPAVFKEVGGTDLVFIIMPMSLR